ncbi:hypothetical protein KNT87_gp180 [Erwinia phage Cronus]|uniref:Uncharacterized protein n=1 Tax=Erwinia phage Cronus TaxID=2163633 RepID=A0A2S1GLY8_9CAUD|nr:hypothetical protein KNT87_gp180 [Erwinia phage Cronus]AWD90389.1 hypothetical protein [Erwinia phage Cronus]
MEIKLIPDPEIDPSFGTYTYSFPTRYNKTTEVWVTRSGLCAGIESGENCILLEKEELFKLQELINQAVKLLEDA